MFNTIAIYDVYIVADSAETAHGTLLKAIHAGDLQPSEHTTTEVTFERNIRNGYRDEKPFVGDDISDKDFKAIQGKTTLAIFHHIYSKRG